MREVKNGKKTYEKLANGENNACAANGHDGAAFSAPRVEKAFPSLALTLALTAAIAAAPIAESGAFAAGSARAVFDNGANVAQYKKTVKRDIFYRPDEKFAKDIEITSGRPKTDAARPAPVRPAAGERQQGEENFRVEAIIRLGEKGCAVINSKIWYVGRNSFGYTLVKLHDESVEIKTPAGNVIKCELIKKKAVEMNDE